MKLTPDGKGLVYKTYVGGDAIDIVSGIAVDAFGQAYLAGELYVAGVTTSRDLPANAYDTTANGSWDVFVFKLGLPLSLIPTVQFRDAVYTVAENGRHVTITVTRNWFVMGAATVRYGAYGGSASAGSDYVPASGVLSFLAGERTKIFQVTILPDLDPNWNQEGTETVALVLSNPTGGMILGRQNTAVLRITDSVLEVPQ